MTASPYRVRPSNEPAKPPGPVIHRILVRGVNWLGDAVMSTPALLRVREAFPDAHVSLLTPSKLADLWLHHPAVDATFPLGPHESILDVARQLRRGRFDLGIILPNSPRSALEMWLGRVPRRVGYATAWRRWFLTDALAQRPGHVAMHKRSPGEVRALTAGRCEPTPDRVPTEAHHIFHYLHLVGAVGANPEPLAPQLFLTPSEVEATARRFGLPMPGPGQPPWFGLNAGAEYGPAKRWPRDRFVAAAVALQRRLDCRWVIFGGRGDVELANSIVAEIPAPGDVSGATRRPAGPSVYNLAGQTTLRELCAALSLCRVLLTNDTGPMHVAAAVGTPVVVPFGSTSPELTGPGLPADPRHRLLLADVPCRPCFLRECPTDFRCLNGITVDQVVTAVLDQLGDRGSG
jgi:heptosyltransferase-2